MATTGPFLYEGLFLMNPSAGGDLAGALGFIREILERANAEVLTIHRWDDRKLAYPIRGQKRGTYILAVFRVNGVQIANIERDCNLSEQVIRALMTRADHLGETEVAGLIEAGKRAQTEVKLRATGEGRGAAGATGAAEQREEQPAEANA